MKRVNLFFILSVVLLVCVACNSKTPEESTAPQTSAEETSVTEAEETSSYNINIITDMASAKLMVDSREVTEEELPSDIRFLASLPIGMKLSYQNAYYTKSDYSSDAYDVLHDYVFGYFDEENDKSIKISACKGDTPLRDYYFNSTKEESKVNGVSMVISQYEDRFITNFEKGRFTFDVETNGLDELELINLLELMTKD